MLTDRQKYAIRFGSEQNTDLDGAFFSQATKIDVSADVPILWDHGRCPIWQKNRLGTARFIHDTKGVQVVPTFIQCSDYVHAALSLFYSGQLGWSTGCYTGSGSDFQKSRRGNKDHIDVWTIDEISLTPHPKEPWLSQNPDVLPNEDSQLKAGGIDSVTQFLHGFNNTHKALTGEAKLSPGLWLAGQLKLRKDYEEKIDKYLQINGVI